MPRITNIEGRQIDMVPSGHMITLFNNNTPGMVGKVGEALGKAKLNIDEMIIGKADDQDMAMMIIKVSQSASDDILSALGSLDGVSKVASVQVS